MATHKDLQNHIEKGVEKIVADTIKATLKNPKESAFMLKFAAASRKASKTRQRYEAEGLHVPGFLIASITSQCNLHCAGCYSRCNHATVDTAPVSQLSREEWKQLRERMISVLETFETGAYENLLEENALRSLQDMPLTVRLKDVTEKVQEFDFDGARRALDEMGRDDG